MPLCQQEPWPEGLNLQVVSLSLRTPVPFSETTWGNLFQSLAQIQVHETQECPF